MTRTKALKQFVTQTEDVNLSDVVIKYLTDDT